MPCRHCKEQGHNYTTCPHLSSEEKLKIKNEIKQQKLQAQERARIRGEQLQQIRLESLRRQRRLLELEKKRKNMSKNYIINNSNEYELACYYYFTNSDSTYMKHFAYIEPHSSKNIKLSKVHTIIIYPTMDVLIENSTNAIKELPMNHPKEPLLKITIHDYEENLKIIKNELKNEYRNSRNIDVINYYNHNENNHIINYYCDVSHIQNPDRIINIQYKQYKKEKTELEQWKEVGLKSNYLLQQLIKLGGKNNENFEPILDLVEDINIPNHNAYDKELAGVPSELTNVT